MNENDESSEQFKNEGDTVYETSTLPMEPPIYESPQPSTSKLLAQRNSSSEFSLPSYSSKSSNQIRKDSKSDVLQVYKMPLIVDRELKSSSICLKRSFPIPPTYSAVLKMGPPIHIPKKKPLNVEIAISGTNFSDRMPPPSYAEVQGGDWSDLPRQISSEEILLGPEPLYVLCPHCSSIVITDTIIQRSSATHFTALALCMFGCWPCCLMPYFMDSCKNTYHHCPVCSYYFGVYRPW